MFRRQNSWIYLQEAVGLVSRHCPAGQRAVPLKFDAVSFVSSLPVVDYDVIFMDPPYSKGLERRVLEVLSTKKFTTDTLIVVEAALDEDFSYVDALGFEITKDKHYKTNKHVFLMQKENI